MFVACIFVNVGMWFERFVIIVTSLAQDFLPSAWGYYTPTWVDIGMLIGSFGLFLTLFMLFIRYLPVIAIAEVKAVMPQAKAHPDEPGTAVHGDYQPRAATEEGH
jgi:Ni/Fe-hydrogenase subunit HybB-like protein